VTEQVAQIPRVGMFATIRNRRGVVAAVDPFDADGGWIHLLQLEYKDDQLPAAEKLLWELEPRKNLLEPTALPVAAGTDPMPAEDFDALLRAARWSGTLPYVDSSDHKSRKQPPISSPLHSAVQLEDFSRF
jgi:hypothetical protein